MSRDTDTSMQRAIRSLAGYAAVFWAVMGVAAILMSNNGSAAGLSGWLWRWRNELGFMLVFPLVILGIPLIRRSFAADAHRLAAMAAFLLISAPAIVLPDIVDALRNAAMTIDPTFTPDPTLLWHAWRNLIVNTGRLAFSAAAFGTFIFGWLLLALSIRRDLDGESEPQAVTPEAVAPPPARLPGSAEPPRSSFGRRRNRPG